MAQELDHPSDVIGHRTPSKRTHLGNTSLDLLHGRIFGGAGRIMPGVVGEHVGLDAAGCDGVDGDALWACVGGEGAGEPFDGRFGAGVQRVVLHAGHVGRDRGHEDYAAALYDGEMVSHGLGWKGWGTGREVG